MARIRLVFSTLILLAGAQLASALPALPCDFNLTKRFLVEPVNAMFQIDLDQMSRAEFHNLVKNWAERKISAVRPPRELAYNESYLIEILKDIGTPDALKQEISEICVRSRLDDFRARSLLGQAYDAERDFHEVHALQQCLKAVNEPATPAGAIFLIDVIKEVTDLHASGWGFRREFLYFAVDELDELMVLARKREDLRAVFAAKLSVLQQSHDVLLNLVEEPAVPGEGPHAGLSYSAETATLALILDVAGTW